ncbi:hypothetical protein [Aeromicrobium sp. UC242_57]|uniref:hypothetical protein n=1 Tax=Aeromicrobium sp. UC242_57 TaxID=3374624 RepID=UPI0037B9A058
MRDPWMVAAFEGWNDAADAASGTVDHLIEEWEAAADRARPRRVLQLPRTPSAGAHDRGR